jgi:hypothetical protein
MAEDPGLSPVSVFGAFSGAMAVPAVGAALSAWDLSAIFPTAAVGLAALAALLLPGRT